ncbi:PREDICTED: uncharacterized protein LOC109586772 isoform X2 [Amphimedon queenslandica]|uniref:Uncharacterized protein n=1 Tax=Amphimedon queenslandica TaxID=400682 RepID=A0AAN0JNZ8_AMPQE|nr:PREDICTED: uncharacterized protein LOC109586772 isoform X2 [Amphimedon queenslandica]|eukprot:XP_019858540.1 PREDICTED: uncharacterized protein LOC109586772 isoform X2 [Amphimedon queenslandica]
MSTTLLVETSSNIKILTRRDSKDSCYSEEMDLSSTSSNSDERGVSPLALSATNSPVSRKNSVSGDSGVSMDCFGDLCKDNSSLSGHFDSRTGRNMNGHSNQFLDKLALMEEKLQRMEELLSSESQKRKALESKVAQLEADNEKLTSLRTQAVAQLQMFSEKFFAMPDPKNTSPVSTPPLQSPKPYSPRVLQSPRHSQLELRRIGSNSSVVSGNSAHRMSGHYPTYPTISSRHSNISL